MTPSTPLHHPPLCPQSCGRQFHSHWLVQTLLGCLGLSNRSLLSKIVETQGRPFSNYCTTQVTEFLLQNIALNFFLSFLCIQSITILKTQLKNPYPPCSVSKHVHNDFYIFCSHMVFISIMCFVLSLCTKDYKYFLVKINITFTFHSIKKFEGI